MNQRLALTGGLAMALWLCGPPHVEVAFSQPASEEEKVLDTLAQISRQFSAAYVQGEVEKMISLYTDDAVIFPGNSELIRGKEAIRKYWTLPPGRTITHHKITAEQPPETGIADKFTRHP